MRVRDISKLIGDAPARRAFARRAALLYAVGAAAWIFGSDLVMIPLLAGTGLLAAASVIKGFAFVAVTALLLYFFLARTPVAISAMATTFATGSPGSALRRGPLPWFVVLLVAMVGTGLWLFVREAAEHRELGLDQVKTRAVLKAREIGGWLDQRADSARSYQYAHFLQENLAGMLRGDPGARARTEQRLEQIRKVLDATSIVILDPAGRSLAATGEEIAGSAELTRTVGEVSARRAPQLQQIRRAAPGPDAPVVIDQVVPVEDAISAATAPAVLVLRDRAEDTVFSMLRHWPATTRTSEAYLVRRNGPRMEFLSGLRERPDAALTPGASLSDATRVGTLMIGGASVTEGALDYRGKEVLAASRPVPGTDWKLIAKIDLQEVMEPAKDQAGFFLATVLGITLLAGIGITMSWRQQAQLAFLREQALGAERTAVGKHLDMLSRYANDIILLHDSSGRLVEANDRAVERYGYPREKLLELSAADLRPADEKEEVAWRMAEVIRLGGQLYETRHRSASGEVFPVEISSRCVSVEGSNYIQAIIRDISERKAAEARIKRLAEAHDALSAVNRAIVRITDDNELYRDICDTIVARAGFRVAWIGLADRESALVRPVAQAGDAENYVSALRIPFDDTVPEGRTLIEQVILSGEPIVLQDIASDPHKAVWHEGARRWELGSMAVIPLRRDGKTIAALSVYAREPGTFDDEYMKLLREMGADVSFALDSIARDRELRESEARFRAMLEQSVAATYVIQDGKVVYVNSRMRELFGYGPGEPFDTDPLAHVAPSERVRVADQLQRRLQGEPQASYTLTAVRRGGGLFTFGISVQVASYLGRPAIIAIGQDITEKERAEAERGDRLRRVEAHLAALTAVTGSASLVAGNVEEFARQLTEAAANATGVERANVWLFNDAETELRCIDLYEATPACHSAGATLAQAQFEPEFAALKANPYVDASEPLTDARTAGYAEGYLKPLRITSMLDAVVRYSGKNLGLLCLEHVDRAHRWQHDEIAFACQLADKLALAITNRDRQQTQQKLRRSLEDSIQAIAATVEARDPYTAGHERRVAEIAAAIATEMALPPFTVEGIHFGALIHDLGKIQVPAEILSKPTRISAVEFELIKGHAQAGYEILKGIDYPWPVAEMARQHHERLDGSGYPRGLKGEEILLEARVLAVADTIEAMASHRPYRPGLGIDKALAEIERGRETAYDPLVVDACLRLFRAKGYRLPS